MKLDKIKRRVDGLRNTPFLWKGERNGLQMYHPEKTLSNSYPKKDQIRETRLGKTVEEFIFFDFYQNPSIDVLISNLQVFNNNITVGEIDCILKELNKYIHLEIIYKFYLLDTSTSLTDDRRWTGPNKNDSLYFKILKLKEKQLPLLHRPETKLILKKYKIDTCRILQKVYFKAQLYIPYQEETVNCDQINKECMQGFYINLKSLEFLRENTFHIPHKLDWIIEPHREVPWMSFENFKMEVIKYTSIKKSPLCWVKSTQNDIKKFFIVWW